MQVLQGHRIAKGAQLTVGAAAVVFDPTRTKILLTQRSDNGQWCLPGGHMESGESAAEACQRETLEETGLQVRVKRLIGVYSSPDYVLAYKDGARKQFCAMCFEAEVIGGELALSNETTAFGWYTPAEALQMDLVAHHRQRIADAFANQAEAFMR
jgi:8-oxo-dGTP pyrophosphatase MutT (NUDIX family)